MAHANDAAIKLPDSVHSLSERGGGKTTSDHQSQEFLRIVPHPRTLRKRVRMLRIWSTMVSLSKRPEPIFITLSPGR